MPPVDTVKLLSSFQESRCLWRLRMVIVRTLVRSALRSSRLQVVSVAIASGILWVGLFALFREGFEFVQLGLIHSGLRTQLIHVMFNVFFLTLTVMLVFSSAIILYGSLYRGDEVRYLMTAPVRPDRIVLHKFHEAVFFSGWGFLLLGSPMLLAYGIVFYAPWHYYALLLPFMIAFVGLPAAAGAIGCLLVVRLLPTVRVHALAVAASIVLALGVYFAWQTFAYQNRDMMSFSWFHDVLSRLQFSEQRMLPSWWLSSGLLEATHGTSIEEGVPPWLESLLFLSVLVSNALFLELILRGVAARTFRASYSSLQGMVPAHRRHGEWWLDRVISALCLPLPSTIRHMIVKDLRLFRRDPMQWSQFAIFFGLLVMYFLNVRRFDYRDVMEQWVTIMSFLNVAVVGLLLSTFTTRFVFPTISLEGRRFWILGTAPISRDTIIWGKFWFACVTAWPVCAVLILISDLALGIGNRSLAIVWIHQLQCLLLCVGLSAQAVGLGARLPNLRESSPARIASGFGGTLNLVISTLYILVVLVVTSVPAYLWAESPGTFSHWLLRHAAGLGSDFGLAAGLVLGVAVGVAGSLGPLQMGLRSFRQLEH